MVKLGQRVEFKDPKAQGISGVSSWQGTVIEDEPNHVRVLTTGTFTRSAARKDLQVTTVEKYEDEMLRQSKLADRAFHEEG